MSTYVQVVQTGSFSAAARVLRLGQPAVSKTIAQLEQHLQVRLLMRSTQGLTPTEAGLRFYEHAQVVLQEVEEAELAARGAGANLSGRLRVSAATTFARLHVIPALPRFLEAHPELEIDVVLDDRPIDLIGEGIDVSLRMGRLADTGLVARRLARTRRLVIASPAYLARAGRPKTPADLAAHQTLVFSQQDSTWEFQRAGRSVSVSVRGRARFSAAEGIRTAVLADMGLTIASEWMFTPELADGRVQAVLSDWSLPDIDLWAVFPSGRMATAKARAFAEFVEVAVNQAGDSG
ncbi:LysR family transcriptional regulator [Pseudoxanthomonas sp. JBR18]|uniref:LysR family transcriptional regulator n=1 Tax=Pseudoxanthomonas sp. JBR18 TaxID=2969308 RepID=UPI002306D0A3|nr:LysR family transcriptional regulator [Pseudoxanthomonas sp. JBR18]WCE05673.1 LysR substrate-binding domain-containing protein [Pseudoxanthomonas sp. JBR18]